MSNIQAQAIKALSHLPKEVADADTEDAWRTKAHAIIGSLFRNPDGSVGDGEGIVNAMIAASKVGKSKEGEYLRKLVTRAQEGLLPVEDGMLFSVDSDGVGILINGSSNEWRLTGAGKIVAGTTDAKAAIAEGVIRATGVQFNERTRLRTPQERLELRKRRGLTRNQATTLTDFLVDKLEYGGGGIRPFFSSAFGFFKKFMDPRQLPSILNKRNLQATADEIE
jgi:hypothetical protein